MATDSMSGEEENDREAPRIAVRFWPRITAAAGGREAGGRGQLHTKFVLWKENIVRSWKCMGGSQRCPPPPPLLGFMAATSAIVLGIEDCVVRAHG